MSVTLSGFNTHYDRQGKPISVLEWSRLFLDDNYKLVAKDIIKNYMVSTVWLGINHNLDLDGPPIIFETMIFLTNGDFSDLYMCRYSTEEEAIEGHKEAIKIAENEEFDYE